MHLKFDVTTIFYMFTETLFALFLVHSKSDIVQLLYNSALLVACTRSPVCYCFIDTGTVVQC